MKMEHVRMRLAHEAISSDLVDMELIELKFIFDRSTISSWHYFCSSPDLPSSTPRQPRLRHYPELPASGSTFVP